MSAKVPEKQVEDLSKPIAARRKRRSLADQKNFSSYENAFIEPKPTKKSQESGWFRVDGIVGHRIIRYRNQDIVELKVMWEGYA